MSGATAVKYGYLTNIKLGFLLAFELFVWVLNVETIVATLSAFNAFSLLGRFLLITPIVILGNFYSYWFWGYMDTNGHGVRMLAAVNWCVNTLPEPIARLVGSFEEFVLGLYYKAKEFDRQKDVRMFVIGAFPLPGIRAISMIYCGLTHWRRGMIMNVLGDITKTSVEIGVFYAIFHAVIWLLGMYS